MRVVVTGGAGFIGSHLVDALLARGDEVTIVDDLSRGRAARLPGEVALRQISVADRSAVRAVIEAAAPEVVFHLAAQIDVRASVADPAADAETNVVGTLNVLTAAQATGARVLFASTGGALYGQDAPVPSAEEVTPEPEAPYGTAKYCAECYLALFNRLYQARHATLRLGNVYGPRQDPAGEAGVVSIFAGRLARGRRPTVFGDGTATRDYVYVGDVVGAFLTAADAAVPGVWNIGTGVETTVLDLVDQLRKAAGEGGADLVPEFAPARPGELQRSCLVVDTAGRDLGWTPTVSLPDGIERVYRWVEEGEPDRGGL